jgi:hypothetical protein
MVVKMYKNSYKISLLIFFSTQVIPISAGTGSVLFVPKEVKRNPNNINETVAFLPALPSGSVYLLGFSPDSEIRMKIVSEPEELVVLWVKIDILADKGSVF